MLHKHKEKQQRLREAAAARSPERSPLPASSQGALQLKLLLAALPASTCAAMPV
jgi:hypothetical protein